MAVNFCKRCGYSTASPGSGRIIDPNAGWKFWKTIVCPDCQGDGYAKPPIGSKFVLSPPPPPPRK